MAHKSRKKIKHSLFLEQATARFEQSTDAIAILLNYNPTKPSELVTDEAHIDRVKYLGQEIVVGAKVNGVPVNQGGVIVDVKEDQEKGRLVFERRVRDYIHSGIATHPSSDATANANPVGGDMYLCSVDGNLWRHNGTDWGVAPIANLRGIQGPRGERGEPGSSVNIRSGNFRSSTDLPDDAHVGDGYLINGELWVKSDVHTEHKGFINVGRIQGPRGTQIHRGGDITDTNTFIGVLVGDYYLHTKEHAIYGPYSQTEKWGEAPLVYLSPNVSTIIGGENNDKVFLAKSWGTDQLKAVNEIDLRGPRGEKGERPIIEREGNQLVYKYESDGAKGVILGDLIDLQGVTIKSGRAEGRFSPDFRKRNGDYYIATDEGAIYGPYSVETNSWGEAIPLGAIKSIKFNGKALPISEDGQVEITLPPITMDETFDVGSNNALPNSVITTKFESIKKNLVSGMEAVVSEDETKVTLSLNMLDGDPISVDIPAGKGGGGGGDAGSKIILTTAVPEENVKMGDSAMMTYTYNNVTNDGAQAPTGIKADIRLTINRGVVELYHKEFTSVSSGTYNIDLSPYTDKDGLIEVKLLATCTTAEGTIQKKQAYAKLAVHNLVLSTTYDLYSGIRGFEPNTMMTIPFAIRGAGNKTITLYVDGIEKTNVSVTKAGLTNSSFSFLLDTNYSKGHHNAQLVAESSIGGANIKSESIYFDFYVGTSDKQPQVGVLFSRKDGRVDTSANNVKAMMVCEQFSELSFEYAVYDALNSSAPTTIKIGDQTPSTLSVTRSTKIYRTTFATNGEIPIVVDCRGVSQTITADIKKGAVDISDTTEGLSLNLSAIGRTSAEKEKATWKYKKIVTKFSPNFDWLSGGWRDGYLHITNGGSIEIPYKMFKEDATNTGCTLELEFFTSNINDNNAPIISCLDGNVGFKATAQKAEIRTASNVEVSTNYAGGQSYRMTFVINSKSGNRLLELYINGIRSGAVRYGNGDSILHQTPKGITISSEGADVAIRNIRVYEKALNDDEVLSNYIYTRPTANEIITLYHSNDVLTDSGDVSIEKLRAKGKSVLRFVGDVKKVIETNNKKFEVPIDVYFYSAYGKQYDFVLKQGGLRIQGTSSTTYPRKNYRIYFDRKKKYGTTLTVGGVEQKELKYSFKPNAIPVPLYTLKADFAESSSTHNSGVAIIINEIWKRAGMLTPPQKTNPNVRIGVDGFPMDAFFASTNEEENTYLGKYNFNNDKSQADEVFGFSGDDCVCLEFLNNSHPLDLFQTADMTKFKDGLEFRFPDQKWEEASEKNKNAVKRLWEWIVSCKNNPTKFKAEVKDYFSVKSLCSWYAMTDYFIMVDQRAKNMMFATWDGLKWYLIPYDNDTILGVRNDGKVVYDYDIDEETMDAQIGSHAFAGHDSVLWDLVRKGLKNEIAEAAQSIRSVMSNEYVLDVLNKQFMGNWSERIYNKDGEYKYIKPLNELGVDYLYSLQGARLAHRSYIIENRFRLLDAKYLAGTYRADNLRIYLAHKFSKDNKSIRIKSNDKFYFGYGYTSGAPKQSGVYASGSGEVVSLTFNTDLIVNDPQYVYGASRFMEVDMKEISPYLIGTINFNNCTNIRKIDMRTQGGNDKITSITTEKCSQLEEIDVYGISGPSFTSLDLSQNAKIKKVNAHRTSITSMNFCEGAIVEQIYIPASMKTLKLVALSKITKEGLIFEDKNSITNLWIEDCPNLDWEEILEMLPNVKFLRANGVRKRESPEYLNKFNNMGGISSTGALINESCSLIGEFQIRGKYLDDEEYSRLTAKFPELSIRQPEYSVYGWVSKIKRQGREDFSDVITTERWINYDNGTGYGTRTAYEASGHVKKIWDTRMAYMGKEEERGTMWVYPVHRNNFTKYLDNDNIENATPVDLKDWTNGNLWIKEPAYWYKGVHDWETGNDYFVVSSNAQMPAVPECKVYNYKAIKEELQPVIQHYIQFLSTWNTDGSVGIEKCIYKYRPDADIESNDVALHRGALALSYIKIPCSGYKRIKMPLNSMGIDSRDTNNFTDIHNKIGGSYFNLGAKQKAPYQDRFAWELPIRQAAVFVNSADKVIKAVQLNPEKYPYCYKDLCVAIPEGAVYCYTSVYTRDIDELTDIVLSNSDAPEDWECTWIEVKERWIATNPLHYEENSNPRMFSTSLNEKRILADPTDASQLRFAEVNSYYDNVSYEEYKDMFNLMYAYHGTFALAEVYGRMGVYAWDSEWSIMSGRSKQKWQTAPERGLRGTSLKSKDGSIGNTIVDRYHSWYVYEDGSGQEDRPLTSYGGHTWLCPTLPITMSVHVKGGVSSSSTKGLGFLFSTKRDMTPKMGEKLGKDLVYIGQGYLITNMYSGSGFYDSRNSECKKVEAFENYGGVGYRKIQGVGTYLSSVNNIVGWRYSVYTTAYSINPIGGKYMDILPRSVDVGINPTTDGGAFSFLGYSFSYDAGQDSLVSNSRDAGGSTNSSNWLGASLIIGKLQFNDMNDSRTRMYVPIFKGRIEYATSLSQFTSKEQYRFIKDENYSNFSW